jgi:thiol-disulfide isomerase/thioredoxin
MTMTATITRWSRLAVLVVLLLAACNKPATWGSAPDFTFKPLAGGADTKLSSLAGKPIVLNFWNDW